MATKKRGLGKGMMALVSDYDLEDDISEEEIRQKVENEIGPISRINVDKIIPNRYQPRKSFDEAALEELAVSIKDKGVIVPILVQDLGDGRYELIAGERRLRASKIAGMEDIPVTIGEFTREDQIEIALIENIQREDLNSIEIALAYKEIMEIESLTQEALAEHIGKSRTSVTNTLRLLKLPDFVQKKVIDGSISEGHGRAILSIGDIDKMIEFTKIIEEEGLSVRQAEKAAKEFAPNKNTSAKKSKVKKDPEMEDVKEKLITALGAKVEISGSKKKGKIQIHYYSPDELKNIYDLINRKD